MQLLQGCRRPFVPAAAADAISPGQRSGGGKPPGRHSSWTTLALPRCSSQTAAGQSSATGGRKHLSVRLGLYLVTDWTDPAVNSGDRWGCVPPARPHPVNDGTVWRGDSPLPGEDGSPSKASFLLPPMLRFPVATEVCRQAATGSHSRRARTNTALWVGPLGMTFRLAPIRFSWKPLNHEECFSICIIWRIDMTC